MPVKQSAHSTSPDRSRIYQTSTGAAFLAARLVIELFEGDYTRLGIGMEVHLLPVFDTFTFPSAIVSFKLGDLRVARLENLLDYLLRGHGESDRREFFSWRTSLYVQRPTWPEGEGSEETDMRPLAQFLLRLFLGPSKPWPDCDSHAPYSGIVARFRHRWRIAPCAQPCRPVYGRTWFPSPSSASVEKRRPHEGGR